MTASQLLLRSSVFLSWIADLFPADSKLHTARFACLHELESLLTPSLNIADTRLLLGVNPLNQVLRVRPTPTRRELGNLLVVARARGGKGLLAVSQLLTWPHSVIVNDIKGELFQQTAGFRSTLGKVLCLDPRGVGHAFEPTLGKYTDLELKSIAKKLLHKPDEKDGEVFTERAARILTALLQAARLENISPLAHVAKLINEPLPFVVERINRVSPKLAVKILECAYAEADFQDKFLTSSWGTLTARLDSLLAESVVQSFTGSDFSMQDVMCSEKPITIYLRLSEEDLLVLSPLVKLLWGSFINGLTTAFDNSQGKNCHPVLLLLDEAASTAVPNLPEYASTVCGRGVSCWIAVQDLSQLDGIYGRYRARSLRNNCDTQIYYRPNDLETAKYLEERLGRKSDYAASRHLREGKETSQGQSEQGVPLLTARNIMELADEEIIGFYGNLKPFRAKRMDWRGFPLLARRRAIAPPKLPVLPALDTRLSDIAGPRRETSPSWQLSPDLMRRGSPTSSRV
jgi:type IV secretion system protein VirD4